MRLDGYIKEIRMNSFSIPIYSDGLKYYCHELTKDFLISGFYEIHITPINYLKIYYAKEFDIKNFAAIAFVGMDRNIFVGSADETLPNVELYIESATNEIDTEFIRQEIDELKSILKKGKKISENQKSVFEIKVNEFEVVESTQLKESDELAFSFDLSMNKIQSEEPLLGQNYTAQIRVNNPIQIIPMTDLNEMGIIRYSLEDYLERQMESDKSESFNTIQKSEPFHDTRELEMTIEETLRLRAEERRKKMKDFNYQFHSLSNLTLDELRQVPAYKRMGVELRAQHSNLSKSTIPINSNSTRDLQDNNKITENVKREDFNQ